jgi:hypothetical protein
MVGFMTGGPRASRIREIFRALQGEEPGPDLGRHIQLCREALGLMTAGKRAGRPAGSWSSTTSSPS